MANHGTARGYHVKKPLRDILWLIAELRPPPVKLTAEGVRLSIPHVPALKRAAVRLLALQIARHAKMAQYKAETRGHPAHVDLIIMQLNTKSEIGHGPFEPSRRILN
jgi:hypothetical protein